MTKLTAHRVFPKRIDLDDFQHENGEQFSWLCIELRGEEYKDALDIDLCWHLPPAKAREALREFARLCLEAADKGVAS